MSSDLTKTEKIKLLPDQVAQLHKKMELTESRIIELGKLGTRVETILERLEPSVNAFFNKIDENQDVINKRISSLEKWRSWTTGIAVTVIAGVGMLKDSIITYFKGNP